jgi:hypothetical protein
LRSLNSLAAVDRYHPMHNAWVDHRGQAKHASIGEENRWAAFMTRRYRGKCWIIYPEGHRLNVKIPWFEPVNMHCGFREN